MRGRGSGSCDGILDVQTTFVTEKGASFRRWDTEPTSTGTTEPVVVTGDDLAPVQT